MAGISVPVPSVDDGAIVAALHIVWALRGRGRNPREPQRRILAIRPFSNVVLAGGRECSVSKRPSMVAAPGHTPPVAMRLRS